MFNQILKKRIQALSSLSEHLKSGDSKLMKIQQEAQINNPWFTELHIQSAIDAWATLLEEQNLTQWLSSYLFSPEQKSQTIGLILAGNIPLVGFHDIITVLISGHKALIKLSSQDVKLIPYLLNYLIEKEPLFKEQIKFTERLSGFDAIIATGSNNTSMHFDYYFGKYPHIIRKNRNGIAVISGNETTEELEAFGKDIFLYFGLGCRNISKVYFPKEYDISKFLDALTIFNSITDHFKYTNNYDYYKSIYLVNREAHLDTGFLLLKENKTLNSPLSVLYYEKYENIQQLEQELSNQQENIQCIASVLNLNVQNQVVKPGQTQNPKLWDYADGVDTLKFLIELNSK